MSIAILTAVSSFARLAFRLHLNSEGCTVPYLDEKIKFDSV